LMDRWTVLRQMVRQTGGCQLACAVSPSWVLNDSCAWMQESTAGTGCGPAILRKALFPPASHLSSTTWQSCMCATHAAQHVHAHTETDLWQPLEVAECNVGHPHTCTQQGMPDSSTSRHEIGRVEGARKHDSDITERNYKDIANVPVLPCSCKHPAAAKLLQASSCRLSATNALQQPCSCNRRFNCCTKTTCAQHFHQSKPAAAAAAAAATDVCAPSQQPPAMAF
jgi:hypothetical protein